MIETQIRTAGGRVLRTVRICEHENAVDVESCVTGETLAQLCPDCDRQILPPDLRDRLPDPGRTGIR